MYSKTTSNALMRPSIFVADCVPQRSHEMKQAGHAAEVVARL